MTESLKTIGAHIADLRIILRQTHDDSEYSDEYLYKLLSETRAFILHQEIQKHRKISEWNFQTWCVKLQPDTYHDCDCIADLGCKVMKSVNKIPKPLLTRYKNYFKVYNINQDYEVDKTTPLKLKRDKLSLTRSGKKGYDIVNEQLVLFNAMGTDTLLIRGIFEDPALVSLSTACTTPSEPCTDITDAEFPLDTRFNILLKELVIKQLLAVQNLPQDITNNARSNQINEK